MKRRQLGASGPEVSAIGLGCMSLSGSSGPTTVAESLATLDAAWEAGIDFLDTANVYGPHISEEVIGRWLKRTGHRPVIATKAGIQRDPDRPANNDATYLEDQLDGSLARLGRDHVDLFYIHRRDPHCAIEDTAAAMGRLIAKGKIGGWGLSEVSPTTLRLAHEITPVTAVQSEYSLWTRQPELGLLQECARLGVAFVPFSPLARGVFGSTPIDPTIEGFDGFRAQMPRFQPPHWERNRDRALAFATLARDHGQTPPALALAWVLAQGDHLIPIPGTRSANHLAEWINAADIDLTPDLASRIDAVLPVGWAWGDRYSDAQWRTPERYC